MRGWRVSEKVPSPRELLARVERALATMGAKYTEYKAREARHRLAADTESDRAKKLEESVKARVEQGKAHGVGMSITALRAHMVTRSAVEIPPIDSQAGDLPEV